MPAVLLVLGLLGSAALYGVHFFGFDKVKQLPGHPLAQTLLSVLMMLTLLSTVLTIATLARVRRRVDELSAQARGESATSSSTNWERLVDRLVPDRVLVHTFPRMDLTHQLREVARHRPAAELGSMPLLDMHQQRLRQPSRPTP